MLNEIIDELRSLRKILKKDFLAPLTSDQRAALFSAFKEIFKTEEDVLHFQGKILNKIKRNLRDENNPYFSEQLSPSPQSALSFILSMNFSVLKANEAEAQAFLKGFDNAEIKSTPNMTKLTVKERYWKFCQRHPFLIAASIAAISTTLLLGAFVLMSALPLLLPPFLSLTAGIFFSLGLSIAGNLVFTGLVGAIIRKVSNVVLFKMSSQAEKRGEMTITSSLKTMVDALEQRAIQKSPKDQRDKAYLTKPDREAFTHLIIKFTTFKYRIPETTALIQSKFYTLRY